MKHTTFRKFLSLLIFLVVCTTVFGYIRQYVELAFSAPYYPQTEDVFSYFSHQSSNSFVQSLSSTFSMLSDSQIALTGFWEVMGFLILLIQRLGWLEIVLFLEILLCYAMKVFSDHDSNKQDSASYLMTLESTLLWSLIATVLYMIVASIYHTSLHIDYQTFVFILATIFSLTAGAILLSMFITMSPIIKRRL